MAQSDPSRTEKPTSKRLSKSREKGSVPKSPDFSKTVVLLLGVVALRLLIGNIVDEMKGIYIWFFGEGLSFVPTRDSLISLFLDLSLRLARILLPFLGVLIVTAYLVVRLQVGSLWATEVLRPKFGQVFNLMNGIKRLMFDVKALVRLARSILQALAVGIAPYLILKNEMQNVLPLYHASVEGTAAYILSVSSKMVLYALVPMVLIGIADLIYQRWNYIEELKMTKQEVKDESKQAMGDPMIKNKQRQKMMNVMQMRMMQNVKKADVVVTNPTHFAVALRYNAMEAPAPVVLAKGADHMAQRIRELARENGVPIKENKPLARALYDQVEVGDMIPEELYQAVAAMLAQINKFKRKR